MVQAALLVQVQYLAQERPHAAGAAKNKQRKKTHTQPAQERVSESFGDAPGSEGATHQAPITSCCSLFWISLAVKYHEEHSWASIGRDTLRARRPLFLGWDIGRAGSGGRESELGWGWAWSASHRATLDVSPAPGGFG